MRRSVSHDANRRQWRSPLAATFVFTLCAGGLAAGCRDSAGNDDRSRTVTGPQVAVGGGTAWTEIALSAAGVPEQVSVLIAEAALSGLPATMPNTPFVLALPAERSTTPFDHVSLDFNPAGHPPAGVYTQPHFDVHFYMITAAERDAITPADPDFAAKLAVRPAAELIPAGYEPNPLPPPGGVPRMGTHWEDRTSHEFHGAAFTHALVYGFYNGTMNFIEPMVAKSFLDARTSETRPIKLPAQYSEPGYYPTRYTVAYDAAARAHRVTLDGFVRRP